MAKYLLEKLNQKTLEKLAFATIDNILYLPPLKAREEMLTALAAEIERRSIAKDSAKEKEEKHDGKEG